MRSGTFFSTLWLGAVETRPEFLQRQVLKESHEMGGLKAPDIAALNSALKVKQSINAVVSIEFSPLGSIDQ